MKINLLDIDNIQKNSFNLHRPNGTQDYLFVQFKSPARVCAGGEYKDAGIGTAIIFDKGCLQSYHARENSAFVHDFMHFFPETDYEEALISGIPKGELLHIPLPESLTFIISEIKSELQEGFTRYKSEIMSNLGVVFLYRLKGATEAPDISASRRANFDLLYNLRREIYQNPKEDWSIDNLSEKAMLSRSYFQYLYKSFFLISPTEDVISARISSAKFFLLSSDMSINKIATECGYTNTEHFIRQFKKKTGTTPEKFRKVYYNM